MAKSNGRRNGNGRGLSKGATIHLDGEVAEELELYSVVLGWTQKRIAEEGTALFFKARPLTKKEREAAEYLMSRREL